MKPETKRWLWLALAIFLLLVIIGSNISDPKCDDQCQLQRQNDRLHCLYNNGTDC